MTFPQYRKYINGQSVFKILSEKECIELKRTGSKIFKYTIVANAFPERLFINDVLNCSENRWVIIHEADFELFNSSATNNTKAKI